MKKMKMMALVMSAVCCCITGTSAMNYTAEKSSAYTEAPRFNWDNKEIDLGDGVTLSYEKDIDHISIKGIDPEWIKGENGQNGHYCEDPKVVTIPAEIEGLPVTKMCGYAFGGYGHETNFTEINFPDTLVDIASCALDGTTWYKNQPDGPVYAGNVLYKYKGDIPKNTTIKVKEGTVAIACSAFGNEVFDTEIENEWELVSRDNSGLVGIELPSSLKYVGGGAFTGCVNLKNVTPAPGAAVDFSDINLATTEWYKSQPDGPVYLGDVFYAYKGEMPKNTDLVIKDGTLAIASCALTPFTDPDNYKIKDCVNLRSVKFPESLEVISDDAFWNCVSIKEVNIPDSVTKIGTGAFSHCSLLSKVKLPKNLTKIEKYLFNYCTSLKDIDIPESVAYVDLFAFTGTGVGNADIPDSTTIYYFGVEKGDVNANNKLDLHDVVEISKEIITKNHLNDQAKEIADYNSNGKVELQDAIGVSKKLLER